MRLCACVCLRADLLQSDLECTNLVSVTKVSFLWICPVLSVVVTVDIKGWGGGEVRAGKVVWAGKEEEIENRDWKASNAKFVRVRKSRIR